MQLNLSAWVDHASGFSPNAARFGPRLLFRHGTRMTTFLSSLCGSAGRGRAHPLPHVGQFCPVTRPSLMRHRLLSCNLPGIRWHVRTGPSMFINTRSTCWTICALAFPCLLRQAFLSDALFFRNFHSFWSVSAVLSRRIAVCRPSTQKALAEALLRGMGSTAAATS